ncbi:MAG: MFS transporter [Planctomycetes bacterium]|nr:MFS transporter [Planctomycetota bacterium]
MNTTERNNKILFWASFFTLIAAGMGFSIRGDILADWGKQFGFTQTELGEITGMGLVGFGVTIIIFSFFADSLGYGKLMIIAFLLHVLAVAATIAAPFAYASYGKPGAYWCLYIGQTCFALANGTCEAVINPLTATLFPTKKTHWLNILHAGWPGGLVLGALVSLGLNQIGGIGWQIRWGIILAPMLLYGALMIGRPFPKSEASASGIGVGQMLMCLLAPLLLFLFLLQALVGYVELGTDSWIINITKTVLGNDDKALMAFIWTNVLMFTLRFFAGPIVHRISPLGLLFSSAILGAVGLTLLGLPATNTVVLWMLAVTVYGIGKTFYWPTMLGVVSERFPKGGAIALGFTGGIGMISAGMLGGPVIGYKQDYAATQNLRAEAPATYSRYKAEEAKAPLPGLEKIAGLDNAKVGVVNDDGKGLVADLELLKKENKTDKNADALNKWWKEDPKAESYAKDDKPKVNQAVLVGGKQALAWTAAVPAAMAIGYLLLILYFRFTGGYRQAHIDETEGGMSEPATPQ